MRLGFLALLAAVLPATAIAAQTPAATKSAAPRPVQIPGVSPAGNAILTRLQAQGDPTLLQLIRQQRALGPAIAAAISAPTVDIDKLSALLKQADGLQAQTRSRQLDRVLTAARALPAADRGPFLREVLTARATAPAAQPGTR